MLCVTKLLEKAINKVSKLSNDQQDALASLMLEELQSEQKWGKLFENTQDILAELSQEALTEHNQGRTKRFP